MKNPGGHESTAPLQNPSNDFLKPGHPNFHCRCASEVLDTFASTPAGLASDEAERRLARFGYNELTRTPRPSPVMRLLAQFNNALIYFLLSAAILAFILGHNVDGSVIIAVVTINAIVGFIQEGKAEKALDAIRGLVSFQARLVRDGHRVHIPTDRIVPGDIVLLEGGDRIPADLRLIETRSLLVEEAILTGESIAVEKETSPVQADASLGDRLCMAYSGTIVAAGQGVGVAVATGVNTEIGRISALLGNIRPMTTPLLRQMNRFGRQITWLAIGAAAALFLFAVSLRDYDPTDALIMVVALAVGVVPEGLPAIITITLAIGVQRMARRNAAIRQLPAVETLGSTSVICSDKTGTLTRNEMTVRRLELTEGSVAVSGVGYDPAGMLEYSPRDGMASQLRAASEELALAGLLCNDAELQFDGKTWAVTGDPMEGALVALAARAGLEAGETRARWRRLDTIPFDARHRYMATLNQTDDGSRRIFVKGAPDELLRLCRLEIGPIGPAPVDERRWLQRIAACAGEGERILGFATKRVPRLTDIIGFPDLDEGLIFLGFAGFMDPPREEAIAAIAECHAAGIAVKMITGDHRDTAAAIARRLGMGEAPLVLTGKDLDAISDADLPDVARDTTVFARTSPEHKLRIVRALQKTGAVVAMTGDGVNDAPALKQADVGVGMGHKGTDAAREAAGMVLLDDNFASIAAAIHEGRVVYDNIRKVTAWTLPTNGGEVLTVIAAILLDFALPMTAVQILWINLLLTVTLGLVLAFEPAEPNVMQRKPRPAGQGLLTPFMLWRVAFVSGLFVAIALGIFFYALGQGNDIETARTMVVNTIIVLEIFYLFNVRYLHTTSFSWRGALGTPAVLAAVAVVVAAQFAYTYLPLMQELFDTRPVRFVDGVLIVSTGVVLMIILEIEKMITRHMGWIGSVIFRRR